MKALNHSKYFSESLILLKDQLEIELTAFNNSKITLFQGNCDIEIALIKESWWKKPSYHLIGLKDELIWKVPISKEIFYQNDIKEYKVQLIFPKAFEAPKSNGSQRCLKVVTSGQGTLEFFLPSSIMSLWIRKIKNVFGN